jgi:sugar porter (SP) family MFS transporter
MGGAGHFRIVVVAGLAGMLFGFDTAVIAGITHALTRVFELTPAGLGWAVSSALWGTLLGALSIGWPGDRWGSRDMLRVVGALYVVSAIGCAYAWNLPSFLAFRFLAGIAIGSSSVLAPVYISEIAPADRRGRLVGLFQVNIVVGILLAYCSNFIVGAVFIGADTWRVKIGMAALPAALFCSLLFTIPQSPRWLALKGRLAEASACLRRLGSTAPDEQLKEFAAASATRGGQSMAALSWAHHSRPILLALALATFNQLSGINAVLYYLNDIFAAAGFTGWSGDLQSVAIGATNLIATLVGMSLIDRAGRKSLLLVGSVGTAVALAGVAFVMGSGTGRGWLLALLVLFIASFAVSQGAVIWVYLSEIFPTAVRARGQGIGSAAHWIMNALISLSFPVIAATSTAAPFVFFACMMLVQFFVVLWYFPETRGLVLERVGDVVDPGPGVRTPPAPGTRSR